MNETTNEAWDQLQRSYQCCGIMNYTDWSSNGTDIGDNFPFSCCEESNTCIPEKMYNGTQTNGCLEKLLRGEIISKSILIVIYSSLLNV